MEPIRSSLEPLKVQEGKTVIGALATPVNSAAQFERTKPDDLVIDIGEMMEWEWTEVHTRAGLESYGYVVAQFKHGEPLWDAFRNSRPVLLRKVNWGITGTIKKVEVMPARYLGGPHELRVDLVGY
jgi:hypothetical protein